MPPLHLINSVLLYHSILVRHSFPPLSADCFLPWDRVTLFVDSANNGCVTVFCFLNGRSGQFQRSVGFRLRLRAQNNSPSGAVVRIAPYCYCQRVLRNLESTGYTATSLLSEGSLGSIRGASYKSLVKPQLKLRWFKPWSKLKFNFFS